MAGPRVSRRRRGATQPAAAALLAAVGFGIVADGAALPAQGAAGADSAGAAVAILPFANAGGAQADAWLGAGIAETLAAALREAGVALVHGEPPEGASDAEAGRALGAGWVVSGSVERRGGRLRISARVVDTATGAVRRTTILNGATAELFTLQDRLAADVRPALPGGARRNRPPPP